MTLVLDNDYASSHNATHIFFLGGPFSQWFNSTFQGRLAPDAPLLEFNCAEQYMMAGKAWLFQDLVILQEIMASHSPREQKALGRKVANFSIQKWDAEAKNIVRRGSFYKFSQDSKLTTFILGTGAKYLVEGADYDPVWGVKLAWDDPLIEDPKNWKGTNWLGECLMDTREVIIRLTQGAEGLTFDEFAWSFSQAA
jgi:ribA/ribD-fused uncharacterized protein